MDWPFMLRWLFDMYCHAPYPKMRGYCSVDILVVLAIFCIAYGLVYRWRLPMVNDDDVVELREE